MSSTMHWDPIELWCDSLTLDVDSLAINGDADKEFMDLLASDCFMLDLSDFALLTDVGPESERSSLISSSAGCKVNIVSMEVHSPTHVSTAMPPITSSTKKSTKKCAKKKSSAKPHSRKTKAKVDQATKVMARKIKQRGYERAYRARLRSKRAEDRALLIQLEANIRDALTHKSPVVLQAQSMHQYVNNSRYNHFVELLLEERLLREEHAAFVCDEKWNVSLDMWGCEGKASQSIRYQLNLLSELQKYPTFHNFTW
uniref:Uncharacterized protein n=1 Tax=Globisporangium ultimum (strain ATCC 200006 / CBS 805.95 / DAOM BR144) TaxID=431595 RepID=K3W5R4_GLOUD